MIRQENIGTEKYDVAFGGRAEVKTAKVSILSIIYGLIVLLSTAVVTVVVLIFGSVMLFQAVHVVLSIAAGIAGMLGYVV